MIKIDWVEYFETKLSHLPRLVVCDRPELKPELIASFTATQSCEDIGDQLV